MCITLAGAELSATKIAFHCNFRTGRHSLIYQNNFENQSNEPNAMVLPILGSNLVFHDTRGYKGILDDIVSQLKPTERDLGGSRGASKSIQVLQVGSYHIVVAQGAKTESIQSALESLPEAKRPTFDNELLNWYLEFYGPKTTLAICCFNGKAAAEPIYCEYQPNDFETAFWPGADSHDGTAPKMGELVERDHELLFGCLLPEGVNDPDMHKLDFGKNVPQVLRDSVWEFISEETGYKQNCDWMTKLADSNTCSWAPVYDQVTALT